VTGGVDLQIALDPSPAPALVDRGRFDQVLGNLLSNAVKFTPEGGEIEVALDLVPEVSEVVKRIPEQSYRERELPRSGSYVRIQVRDSGIGIPQEALGTIFDRFVQAKNRRLGKTRGTGLGLAFCRKAVDAHSGYIWAESTPDVGSLFTVLLPALPDEEPEE